MRLFISFLFLFSFAAEAKLTVLCQAEQFQVRTTRYKNNRTLIEPIENTRVTEVQERDLVFTPSSGDTYRAELKFKYDLLPDVDLILEIRETLNGNKIKYSTQSTLVRQGAVIARGTNWISLQTNRTQKVYFHCDSYNKTESLVPPPTPQSLRERLRRQLGAPGATRVYAKQKDPVKLRNGEESEMTGLFDLDAYDLYQQVIVTQGEGAEILRATLKNLSARGFKPLTLSAIDHLAIGYWGSATLKAPGLELVELKIHLYGPLNQKQEGYPYRALALDYSVEVRRDLKTRVIQSYKVLPQIRLSGVESETGGNANTSGGRIHVRDR